MWCGRCVRGTWSKYYRFTSTKRTDVKRYQYLFPFCTEIPHSDALCGKCTKRIRNRTVFNILGPLSNPAGANMQVMGVYDEKLVEPLARVLSNLGVKNAMVVYGQDCLDEISMSARTSVCEIKDGKFRSYEIEPEQFGFKKCDKEELVGGTPEENAKITLSILNGEKGPRREAGFNDGRSSFLCGRKSRYFRRCCEACLLRSFTVEKQRQDWMNLLSYQIRNKKLQRQRTHDRIGQIELDQHKKILRVHIIK